MARNKLTPYTRVEVADLIGYFGEVRQQGYAVSDEELELGVRSLAVSVRDRSGQTVGAISIVSSISRRSLTDMVDNLLPELGRARWLIASLL